MDDRFIDAVIDGGMFMSVYRCFAEKRAGFDVEAQAALRDLRDFLGIRGLETVRILNRYDVEGISESIYQHARDIVFAEPQIDDIYDETHPDFAKGCKTLSVEALPGQYDQRADSCAQCIALLSRSELPIVQTAKVYMFYGNINDDDMDKIRTYLINPVESREASDEKPETLTAPQPEPKPVETLDGFIMADDDGLRRYLDGYALAMDMADIRFMQAYFRDEEKRDPTETELRLIDTYWSDHCRHTTFNTIITEVSIEDERIKAAYDRYLDARREVYGDMADARPVTLMDMATIAAKVLRKRGYMKNIDISEEVNACSIHVDAVVDGETEDWLLMFKNETHNHPTEVEPFGGAATCVGGAIRDPLSGRAFVYQAMRITGSGDPRAAVEDTLRGKLPQRKLTVTAARGYSSYGNQIGLAAGLVHEIYHPGYIAKRFELGAVVGAVRADSVVRETPSPGDKVILLGGRTGRDGIGGATGSSKSHTTQSIVTMASEVQKGNAPEERKIQRLFLDPSVSRIIKKCNDFGAGGVAVAVGELADGLDIDLSLVRRKYEGLNGTEIAISESQERMAVVVAPENADSFIAKAAGENLEAYAIAEVTSTPRMIMRHDGATIVNLSRAFLSTNGATRTANVRERKEERGKRKEIWQQPMANRTSSVGAACGCPSSDEQQPTSQCTLPLVGAACGRPSSDEQRLTSQCTPPPVGAACGCPVLNGQQPTAISSIFKTLVGDLRFCSRRGLFEMFDGTVGASSVLMKNGGRTQSTPVQAMAALLPVGFDLSHKTTSTCSVMSYGFDPYLSTADPFIGAKTAVVTSVAKLVAAGCDPDSAYLTFQEYFERLHDDPARWSKPFSALLGAFEAQMELGLAAIGGKDSMSGSFNDMDVPPTLVSFAIAPNDAALVLSPEFKEAGHEVAIFGMDISTLPEMKKTWKQFRALVEEKAIVSAWAITEGGAAEGIFKMSIGNEIGFESAESIAPETLFAHTPGAIIAETRRPIPGTLTIGQTIPEPQIKIADETLSLSELKATWEDTLEPVFPTEAAPNQRIAGRTRNDESTCNKAQDNHEAKFPSLGGVPP